MTRVRRSGRFDGLAQAAAPLAPRPAPPIERRLPGRPPPLRTRTGHHVSRNKDNSKGVTEEVELELIGKLKKVILCSWAEAVGAAASGI
ncbi:hypothetical protein EVAR_88593_1 [Eumeta japonica]|uniref:Uncharacterized protein n=1 Tax=Eumeta variegata TaxID=151549 RepID=A0A4C1YAE1_EUMVA|nr:hypothetical protein EVAR_88593_1 [Eumeta japonica]